MNGISRGLVVTKDNIIVRSDGTSPGIYCIKKDASATVWHVPAAGSPSSPAYGFFDQNYWYGNAAIKPSSTTVDGLCKIKANTGEVKWANADLKNCRELCFLPDRVVCFSGDERLPSVTSFNYTTGAIIASKGCNQFIPGYSVLGSMGMATVDERLFVIAVDGDPPDSTSLDQSSAKLICLDKTLAILWSVDLKSSKDAVMIAPRVRVLKNKVWVAGADVNLTQNDYAVVTYAKPDPPPLLSYDVAFGYLAYNPDTFPPASPASYLLGTTNLDQSTTTGPLSWCPVGPYTKIVRGLVGSQGWIKSFDKNTGVVLNSIDTGNFPVLPGSMPRSKEVTKIPQYMFPGKEFFGVLFWNMPCTEPANYRPGFLSSKDFNNFPWHDLELKTYDYNGNAIESFSLGPCYPVPSTLYGSGPITNRVVNGYFGPLSISHMVANGAGSNGVVLFIKDLISPWISNVYQLTANSLYPVGFVNTNLGWEGINVGAASRGFPYPDIVVSDNHVYYIDTNTNLQRLGLSL